MTRVHAALLLLVLPLAARGAAAGPVEARRLWDRARTLRDASWRDRVAAYRAVVLETPGVDRLRARALLAAASVLREADHAHAAAALEAWAGRAVPKGEELRPQALLRLAEGLRAEGDLAAARSVLEAAEAEGRVADPRSADRALDVASEDAAAQGDAALLSDLRARARRDRRAPHVRIRVAGRAGLLALESGDREGAIRLLEEAEALAREAARRDDAEAILATKAWLALPLRERLR